MSVRTHVQLYMCLTAMMTAAIHAIQGPKRSSRLFSELTLLFWGSPTAARYCFHIGPLRGLSLRISAGMKHYERGPGRRRFGLRRFLGAAKAALVLSLSPSVASFPGN